MGEVFIYMFFVGAGISLGAAVVALASWKVYQRANKKKDKRKGVSF